jgi:hypothetical protein
MEDSLFWYGIAALFTAVLFAGFSVGVLVGYKLACGLKTAGLSNEQEALVKYFHSATDIYCSKKSPGAFHVNPVCGVFDLKPLQLCGHCFRQMKKHK